jgi:hypothetical protein
MVRLEGLSKSKIFMTSSGLESAIIRPSASASTIYATACSLDLRTNLTKIERTNKDISKIITLWLYSASELYRSSYRRLSAKLVPTFENGCASRGQGKGYDHNICF